MAEKLNLRSDKFTIVLNDNELNLFKSSKHIVDVLTTVDEWCPSYIAVIKHDRDYDKELNQYKTVHYHVVLSLECNCRIGTLLNRFTSLFYCNENQVTIDKCSSLCSQSRYLLHLDDYDKAKYLPVDVVTNNIELFDKYITMERVKDLNDLICLVQRYHYDLEEIMVHISNYDKWRKYINDLIINYNRKRY